MKEAFTVVVPTGGRESTIESTLRTCLDQDYENLTILVCDNSSSKKTGDIVASLGDKRLNLVRTPRRLCMAENWEFALQYLSEGVVTFIGDDDGLLPGCINRVAEIMAGFPHIDCLTHMPSNYFWPDFYQPNLAGKVQVPILNFRLDVLDSRIALQEVANFERWYGTLPMLYHGFVRVSFLKKIKSLSDKPFFNFASPDIYSDLLLAMHSDQYLFLGDSLTLGGQSASSTGARYGSDKEFRAKFANELPEHLRMTYTTTSITLHLYEALTRAKSVYRDIASSLVINRQALASRLLVESRSMDLKDSKEMLAILKKDFSKFSHILLNPSIPAPRRISLRHYAVKSKELIGVILNKIEHRSPGFKNKALRAYRAFVGLIYCLASKNQAHSFGSVKISNELVFTSGPGSDLRSLGVFTIHDAVKRLSFDLRYAKAVRSLPPKVIEYLLDMPSYLDILLVLLDTSQDFRILDIGACEGEDSIRYSLLFPGAEVIAF